MKFRIIFILFIFSLKSNASVPDTTRAELMSLLKVRNQLFEKYSESLANKSGIFGNKTKNDLRDSHDRLAEIVQADNKIMNALNRALSYRNFEKVNMSLDVNSFEERIKNLSVLNDTLVRQNKTFLEKEKKFHSIQKRHRVYFALLILLLILSTGAWLRQIFRK